MEQDQVDALVAQALANSDARALFDAVNAASPVHFVPAEDACWATLTKEGQTAVHVAPTGWPTESMYHELLHAQLKVNGFRSSMTMTGLADNGDQLTGLTTALDNELQHHRIFPRYVNAGFDPARFYNDNDHGTYRYIRKQLKAIDPNQTSVAALFIRYLSVIAPGGAGEEREREQLLRFFRARVPKEKMLKLDAAADRLIGWGLSDESEAYPAVVDILRIVGGFDGWWIGASEAFPEDGLFTSQKFTLEDVRRCTALRG